MASPTRIVADAAGASAFVSMRSLGGDRSNFVTLLPDGLGVPDEGDLCMADDAGSYTYDDTGTTCTQSG